MNQSRNSNTNNGNCKETKTPTMNSPSQNPYEIQKSRSIIINNNNHNANHLNLVETMRDWNEEGNHNNNSSIGKKMTLSELISQYCFIDLFRWLQNQRSISYALLSEILFEVLSHSNSNPMFQYEYHQSKAQLDILHFIFSVAPAEIVRMVQASTNSTVLHLLLPLRVPANLLSMKLSMVQQILERNCSLLSIPDHLGRVLLHIACMPEYSQVVEYPIYVEVLKGCKGASFIKDQNGLTPLHYLIMGTTSTSNTFYTRDICQHKIRWMLQLNPLIQTQLENSGSALNLSPNRNFAPHSSSIVPKNHRALLEDNSLNSASFSAGFTLDRLPNHQRSNYNHRQQAIEDTNETSSSDAPNEILASANKSTDSSLLSLHENPLIDRLCTSKEWSTITEMIRQQPDHALTNIRGKNNKTTTILHQIMASKDKDDMAARVLLANTIIDLKPEAASINNGYKSLPLHICIRNSYGMRTTNNDRKNDLVELFRKLINAYPDAVTSENAVKRNPLHIACSHFCPTSIVKLLLDTAPSAASMKDNQGFLPLHLACKRRCSTDKIFLLLNAYPKSIVVRTQDGLTPVQLAQKAPEKSQQNDFLMTVLIQREKSHRTMVEAMDSDHKNHRSLINSDDVLVQVQSNPKMDSVKKSYQEKNDSGDHDILDLDQKRPAQ